MQDSPPRRPATAARCPAFTGTSAAGASGDGRAGQRGAHVNCGLHCSAAQLCPCRETHTTPHHTWHPPTRQQAQGAAPQRAVALASRLLLAGICRELQQAAGVGAGALAVQLKAQRLRGGGAGLRVGTSAYEAAAKVAAAARADALRMPEPPPFPSPRSHARSPAPTCALENCSRKLPMNPRLRMWTRLPRPPPLVPSTVGSSAKISSPCSPRFAIVARWNESVSFT